MRKRHFHYKNDAKSVTTPTMAMLTDEMALLKRALLPLLIVQALRLEKSVGGVMVLPDGTLAGSEPSVAVWPKAADSPGFNSLGCLQHNSASCDCADVQDSDTLLKPSLKKVYTLTHVVGFPLKLISASIPTSPYGHN